MKIMHKRSTFIIVPITRKGNEVVHVMNSLMISKKTIPRWNKIRRKLVYEEVLDRQWNCSSGSEHIYHNSASDRLAEAMDMVGFNISDIKMESIPVVRGSKIELEHTDSRELRYYQTKSLRDILGRDAKQYYILTYKPGKGKTMVGCHTVKGMSKRTLVIVLAKYINKWEEDLRDSFKLEKDDIYKVSGYASLEKLMNLKYNELPKFIIISTRTYANYINHYECDETFLYTVRPPDLAKKLGIGLVLSDETHNEFHVVYKCFVYSDVKTLAMSGTFGSKSKWVREYMDDIFPVVDRKDYVDDEPYQNYLAVMYDLKLAPYEMTFINPSQGYSDMNYESLLFGPARDYRFRPIATEVINVKGKEIVIKPPLYSKVYNTYMMDMIVQYMRTHFIDVRKSKHKLIIYNSLVLSCDALVARLSEEYPKLTIVRYTQDDDYGVIANADVIISTVLSSGEAFDIKDLYRVFMMLNVESDVKNLQASGRLRQLDDEEVEFLYFVNRNIHKHLSYHQHRRWLFNPDAKTFKTENYVKSSDDLASLISEIDDDLGIPF